MRISLLKMSDFLSPAGYLAEYCSGQLFEDEEHAMVGEVTGQCWFEKMPADVARLYYLCSVKILCGRYNDSNAAALPFAAEVLGLPLRAFVPGVWSRNMPIFPELEVIAEHQKRAPP